MAQPTTREEFKDYCLRKLGAPVIQINLSDEQIEDRIDEAIDFYRDYHYDGSQLVYLKHIIAQEEIDQGWVPVDSNLLGVTRIFDLSSSSTAGGMFNANYQFALNNASQIANFDLPGYYSSMQHLALIQEILVGKPLIRYNRRIDKLYIDVNKAALVAGEYIIIEGYDIIDPDVYSDFWKDRWLQNYASTLIKENWGSVLTKFPDMQLMGGMSFNGSQIYSDAREERKEMEEKAINTLQPLLHNFQG